MFILKQIKNNLYFCIKGNFNEGGGNNQAEMLKNIEPTIDEKKAYIKEMIKAGKLISLEDDEKLRKDIEEKLNKGELDEKQINTIYKNLKIIDSEESRIKKEVIEKQRSEKQKLLEERQKKIKEMKFYEKKERVVEQADSIEFINNTLELSYTPEEKAIIKEAQKIKEAEKNIKNSVKLEISQEKLQKISNHDFLSISFENRLQYITKNNIDSKKIASGDIKDIEFTFTFDGKFNRELWLKTTAGQVLPKEVEVVKSAGKEYKRKGLAGEFFTDGGARLIIHEGTKIKIEKFRKVDEIKKLQEANNQKVQEVLKKNKDFEKYEDIVKEAVKRGIDPKFAIKAFSEQIKDLKPLDIKRQILIEEMFTEYDRKKGELPSAVKDKEEGVKVEILKKYGGTEWKKKAKEVGIKENAIKNFGKIEYTNNREFVSLVTRIAKEVENKYNIPRQITLGQAILESGYGKSSLAKKYNNFFGQNAAPGEKSVLMNDHGHMRHFAVYNTPLEGLMSHGKFMHNGHYNGAIEQFKGDKNPRKFLENIAPIYAEDPNYVNKIVNVLKSNGVYI